MPFYCRVKVVLDGWAGGPGVNTFAFDPTSQNEGVVEANATAFTDNIFNVYRALTASVPSGWSASADPTVEMRDVDTGALIGLVAYTPPDEVNSAVTAAEGAASRATQMVASYTTDLVHSGRLVRGRSFLGPLIPAAITNQGQVQPVLRLTVENAYDLAIEQGMPRLSVYSAPRAGVAGALGHVTIVRCPELPGSLRSRRD